ncbi:MAG: SCP2 sterol-binding domain-containing protein [Solirubrobacterales bacterium]
MTRIDSQASEEIAASIAGGELDPAEVARLIRELPSDQLRDLLGDEVLAAATDEIIRRFPDYVDVTRTAGVTAAVGFQIIGDRRRERFVVLFDDGRVSAGRELDAEPRVTLELDGADFLRLVTGNADPAMMFLSGRLGLRGDELFAVEMASFLSIPGAEGDARAASALDPGRVDATEIARVVRDAPDDALRAGMRGGIRELILEEIFRRFPEYAQGHRIADLDAVIGFKVTGRADGGADRYRVVIHAGEVHAGKDLDADPRVTIVCDGADFLRLVTGNSNPVMGFITGKLKIKGDLGFAAQIPTLFRIPSPAG